MRTLFILTALTVVSITCTAFAQLTQVRQIGSYQCPNHPEIQATWPARCPICYRVLADVRLTAGGGGAAGVAAGGGAGAAGVAAGGGPGAAGVAAGGGPGAPGAAAGGRGITGRAVPGGREEGGFRSEPRGFGGGQREGREFGQEQFPGEGFEGQEFGQERFPGEGFEGRGFGQERFPGEGFGGEGFEGEGFGDEGFGGEGFGGEGFGDEGGDGESMSRIAAMPEAAAPVRIGDAYFCPRCGMPLRDIQATTQGQDQSQGTLGNEQWRGQPQDQQYGSQNYPFYSGSRYGGQGYNPPYSASPGYIPPSYPAQTYRQEGYYPPYPDQDYGQGEYSYPPSDEYDQTYPQDSYGRIRNELNRLVGGGGSAPSQ